jgi:hypothetical protein
LSLPQYNNESVVTKERAPTSSGELDELEETHSLSFPQARLVSLLGPTLQIDFSI